MKTIFFGGGKIGRKFVRYYHSQGKEVSFIVDNDSTRVGSWIYGVSVKSVEVLSDISEPYEILITCAEKHFEEISKQLRKMGISNFKLYDEKALQTFLRTRPRVISYCHTSDMEDVILYHVFEEYENIFYIDIGSNDPCIHSVTKFLYDSKRGTGINVDPQKHIIAITNIERSRDTNLCVGVADKDGFLPFYDYGGLGAGNTFDISNKTEHSWENIVPVTTLKKICDQYVHDTEISFLKIDVEGYEKQVLMGADFQMYRPLLIVIESTLPNTMIPCHENWEYILTEQGYHFSFAHGVNRYYVRDDCMNLDKRFRMIDDFDCIFDLYDVYCIEFKKR